MPSWPREHGRRVGTVGRVLRRARRGLGRVHAAGRSPLATLARRAAAALALDAPDQRGVAGHRVSAHIRVRRTVLLRAVPHDHLGDRDGHRAGLPVARAADGPRSDGRERGPRRRVSASPTHSTVIGPSRAATPRASTTSTRHTPHSRSVLRRGRRMSRWTRFVSEVTRSALPHRGRQSGCTRRRERITSSATGAATRSSSRSARGCACTSPTIRCGDADGTAGVRSTDPLRRRRAIGARRLPSSRR